MSDSLRPRHQWEKLEVHRYRCRVCGCVKTNQEGPRAFDGLPPRWVASFEWGGQVRVGRTPPCPGHLPRPAAIAAPSLHRSADHFREVTNMMPPAASPPPILPPAPALRPVRAFLPLLAGPADQVADAYRAWLAEPRVPRGGCGTCRHWTAHDRCTHPAHGPAPVAAAAARAPSGWPLADFGPVTLILRPLRTDRAYAEGGRCGPLAALWEPRLFTPPKAEERQ